MNLFSEKIFSLGSSLGIVSKIRNYLSITLKINYLPRLIKRDSAFKCFYCQKLLELNHFIYEHLNDNRFDNRIENIVLACQSCNNRKTNDPEMKEKALQKLKENESGNCKREKISENEDFSDEMPTEMKVGKKNLKITHQHINKQITTDGFISESDAIYSSAYRCIEETGHGSVQCSRNYVKILTSGAGPFKIVRDENKRKIIVKRNDNFDDNLRGEK